MKVSLRQISGPWDAGWVLDKHTLNSVYLGDNEQGHPQFDTTRSETGEATYQLKYRQDWSQATALGNAIAAEICPKLADIGFIVPMPATNARVRQPVTDVANAVGAATGKPVIENLLITAANGTSLKNLHTKEEKLAAIGDSLSIVDRITNQGRWNVLLVDDLYDSGASMEAACKVLRSYPKVNKVYVAALTWK